MNEQLNKKLAVWAFKNVPCTAPSSPCEGGDFEAPDGTMFYGIYGLPDFPKSLDACFKWLVPKLAQAQVHKCYEPNTFYGYCEQSFPEQPQIIQAVALEVAETPALALCLAIEKLIK